MRDRPQLTGNLNEDKPFQKMDVTASCHIIVKKKTAVVVLLNGEVFRVHLEDPQPA